MELRAVNGNGNASAQGIGAGPGTGPGAAAADGTSGDMAPNGSSASPAAPGANRVKNACTECKRRKVKCDGTEPCYYCRWYKHPERCSYPRPAPRPSLTRKSLDTLRSKLGDATNVLTRLFPNSSLDDLVPLSREALIGLLNEGEASLQQRALVPSNAGSAGNTLSSPETSNAAGSGRSPGAFEYDESVENLEGVEAVADDVNALSLRQDRTSSYVGASSATAGLRILLKLAPDLRLAQPKQQQGQQPGSPPASPGPSAQLTSDAAQRAVVAKAGTRDARGLVDAYFHCIHPTTPIIDEAHFRATFELNERKDSAWLALLHMVFALGTIAYTTSDCNDDIYHYRVAKSHVNLDSFGSGRIETLQALALMTGWYLHYRNRPNMASAIMGAVFRMANALGLHKELPGEETPQDRPERELRRRIWWSLVILDTGEGTTLGRVSNTNVFDCEVKIPKNIDDRSGEVVNGPTAYSMLIADIEFSRQASKIQERLITSPSLDFAETLSLDAHLAYWHESLPSFLRTGEQCPDWLTQPRLGSKWKYLNLRIILHRPTLMEAALRRTPFQDLERDQKVSVRKCQSLAGEAIDSISSEWTKNQYSGWPAVWLLFQACIIPLLSLYGFNDDTQQTKAWTQQVQKAIQSFKEMEPWSIAARQTHRLISLLYEAYFKYQGAVNAPVDQTASFMAQMGQADPTQPMMGPTGAAQTQGNMEWPLWEGVLNFPDLMSPVSAFPDLNFPEMGPGMNNWDIPMAIDTWNDQLATPVQAPLPPPPPQQQQQMVPPDERIMRRNHMYNERVARRR